MKKHLLTLVALAAIAFSCKRDENFSPSQEEKISQLKQQLKLQTQLD